MGYKKQNSFLSNRKHDGDSPQFQQLWGPSSPAAAISPPSLKLLQSYSFVGTCFSGELHQQEDRDLTELAFAAPRTSSHVFAFIFALSLLVVAIYSSLKGGGNLTGGFIEEVFHFQFLFSRPFSVIGSISVCGLNSLA